MRIKNIPIKIHWSWFIIFGLLTWFLSFNYFPTQVKYTSSLVYLAAGIISTILIFVSVFLHELGHAVYALKKGINVKNITLHAFGGIAQIEKEQSNPKDDFLFAVSGPFVSLILAMGFFLFKDNIITKYLSVVNFTIFFFNMIPLFPLDGGRVLRAVVWKITKDYIKATNIVSTLGVYLSLFLVALGIFLVILRQFNGIMLIFLGTFLRLVADQYKKQFDIEQDVSVSKIMIPLEKTISVPYNTTIDDFLNNYFLIFGFHSYPVIKDDQAIGILDYWILQEKLKNSHQHFSAKKQVGSLAIRGAVISVDKKVSYALQQMTFLGVNSLLVEDKDKKITGFLTRSAILRYLFYAKQNSFIKE